MSEGIPGVPLEKNGETMYPHTREGQQDKKQDIKRLLRQLIETQDLPAFRPTWLGQKALESDGSHSIETMWLVYLSVMKKVGGRLFSDRLYCDPTHPRLESTFRKIFAEKQYEIMIKLAYGAACLFEQVKSTGYLGIAPELRALADDYMIRLLALAHQARDDGGFSNIMKWELIRLSNRVFASVFDAVDEAACYTGSPHRIAAYRFELAQLDRKSSAGDYFDKLFEKQLAPHAYRKKRIKRSIQRFRRKLRRRW